MVPPGSSSWSALLLQAGGADCAFHSAHVRVAVQVHGGPPVACGASLDAMRRISRNCEPPESGAMCEMLWNDPQDEPGLVPNKVCV